MRLVALSGVLCVRSSVFRAIGARFGFTVTSKPPTVLTISGLWGGGVGSASNGSGREARAQSFSSTASRSGPRVRASWILRPGFRADEITERWRAKPAAPRRVRKPPEILIFTFIILESRSARLLVKGTAKPVRNRRVASLKVSSRMRRLWAGRCFSRFFRFGEGSKAGRLLCRARPSRTAAQYRSSNALMVSAGSAEAPCALAYCTASLASRSVARRASAQGSLSNSSTA